MLIRRFINQSVELMRTGFTGLLSSPMSRIVGGPQGVPIISSVPLLVMSPGSFQMEQQARLGGSSEPRPRSLKEEIAINGGAPAGPYALAQQPLEDTVTCTLVFDQGTVNERTQLLFPNQDFTVDLAGPSVSFVSDVSAASAVVVSYSYVGVFSLREFTQELQLLVYATQAADAEAYGAMATAMLVTNQQELLEEFNINDPSLYAANQYLAIPTLDDMTIVGGNMEMLDGGLFVQTIDLQLKGQLTSSKQITGGFGIIEQVRSPGVSSSDPVDVEIGLG